MYVVIGAHKYENLPGCEVYIFALTTDWAVANNAFDHAKSKVQDVDLVELPSNFVWLPGAPLYSGHHPDVKTLRAYHPPLVT